MAATTTIPIRGKGGRNGTSQSGASEQLLQDAFAMRLLARDGNREASQRS